jgi:hypothetical protein
VRAHGARVGGHEQRIDDRPAGVAGRVEALAVARRDGHLQRLLDAPAAARLLDEAGHALQRGQRLLLHAEGEREVEHQLGVRRAGDAGEDRRLDRRSSSRRRSR